MSQKITSKNLSYDTSLPPFLAALRAQSSGNGGPDPISAAQRRSAKKRSDSEEAEDVPLVVDEDGNVVQVEVDKDGVVTEKPKAGSAEPQSDEAAKEAKVEGKSAIGGRKRKVGKVVGEDAEEKDVKDSGSKKTKDGEKEASKDRKPKKKAKKIKLSFDEEDG